MTTVYQALARAIDAMRASQESGNHEWIARHRDSAESIVREHLPHGSGVDDGVHIDWKRSGPDRLVLLTSFHHMDEYGRYDGWTDHTIKVTPSLAHEINLVVTGRNRNDIKDYLGELFYDALTEEVGDV